MLLLLLALCSSIAFSQNKKEIKELFWGSKDPYKSANTIPDKWKNESAVVICKNETYDFHKFGVNVTYTSSVRKRIKLLDQAAVKEFSEFSFKDRFMSNKGFTWKKGTNTLGIKVVKPDGTEREINIDEEAVTTDESKKVAISSLEIGDIIDFYYHSVEPFKSAYEFGFKPQEATLGDEYPIMNLKLTFNTENDFFVNFNTYNGAPELQEISKKGSSDRQYELVATDIEKNDFPRWFYPLVELPCYKFQVYFARSGKFEERAAAFLPQKENIIKKTVSKEDVLAYYDSKFWPLGDLGDIERFLKKKTFATTEEKVKAVYYYCRHQYYTRYVEAFVADDAKIMSPYALYKNPIFFNSEAPFIRHFMAFLKDNKIEYDIIVATPRFNGPIKDLLLQDNTELVIKVLAENPVYLQFFSPYTDADRLSYNLENSDAYQLKVSKRKKVTDVENIKLPGSAYQDNKTRQVSNVSIDPDFSMLKVDRESFITGHLKDGEQKDKMYFFNYVDQDYEKYETTPLMELVGNKKKREQYTKEFDALKDKLKDKQKKEFKESTQNEYSFEIDDHTFEVTNTGRFGKADPFTFKETFNIKNNLIKQAGQNYVIEIGKLIGEQIKLEEKEYKRTNGIYSVFPRSYEEEIIFTIPDGYTVSGLEKLNKNVENTTGGFISTAKLEGNKLSIKSSKYYKNYFDRSDNWKDMTAFLDVAYQFTQEKILLKKS